MAGENVGKSISNLIDGSTNYTSTHTHTYTHFLLFLFRYMQTKEVDLGQNSFYVSYLLLDRNCGV